MNSALVDSLARANGRGSASQCPGSHVAENPGSPGAVGRVAAGTLAPGAVPTHLAVGPGDSSLARDLRLRIRRARRVMHQLGVRCEIRTAVAADNPRLKSAYAEGAERDAESALWWSHQLVKLKGALAALQAVRA